MATAPAPPLLLPSAAGLVSLLDESDDTLVLYALRRLNDLADSYWPEISDSLSKIEIFCEDKDSPRYTLSGLLAAKVYYHLGALEQSAKYALGAYPLFDLDSKSEFVETILSICIDKYIAARNAPTTTPDADPEFTKQLNVVIEAIFMRCFNDKEYAQAIGIAIESRRLDIVERAIHAGDTPALLHYVSNSCTKVILDQSFRTEILLLLVKIYSQLQEPDYFSMVLCLVMLNDAAKCVELLTDLSVRSEHHQLVALQVAFDLEEMACQDFLGRVRSGLELQSADNYTISTMRNILNGHIRIQLYLEFLHRNNHADTQILKTTRGALDARSSLQHSALTLANAFMHAGTTSDLFLRESLDWLSRANNWCKFTATAALGVIHKGQIAQSMSLLRPYLPYSSSPAPGSGGSGTNAVGGNQSTMSSVFSEGGALYALGLLNANHSQPLFYLVHSLRKANDPVIMHGACLGIGACAMATAKLDIVEDLKGTLFADNAVASDAAALGIGMVMAGSGNREVLGDMLRYARETEHERIIRSIALGVALIMFGQEENAMPDIDALLANKDALLRFGGVYMLALAFAGTANNRALKQLLHIAVSDVDDTVRRAAMTAVGFLFLNNGSQVPRIVELLVESFNPHVRYGACMALGIAAASTNMPEALELLAPLQSDTSDFVRQGALIAQSLVQVQQTGAEITKLRTHLGKVIGDKRETPLCKFGAVMAQGILDAGGRNCCVSLRSRSGRLNMPSIIGMVMFLQYWNWYPLAHFLSLAMQPTALIALDKNLRLPNFSFTSRAKASRFAYPITAPQPTTEKIERMTAVLSTSAKVSARRRRKISMAAATAAAATGNETTSADASVPLASSQTQDMDIDHPGAAAGKQDSSAHGAADMEIVASAASGGTSSGSKASSKLSNATTTGAAAAAASGAPKSPRKRSAKGARGRKGIHNEKKDNLTRVLPAQERYISFANCKYTPVRKTRMSDILVMEPAATSTTENDSEAKAENDFILLNVNLKCGGGDISSVNAPEVPIDETMQRMATAAANAALGVEGPAPTENTAADSQAGFEYDFDDATGGGPPAPPGGQGPSGNSGGNNAGQDRRGS